MNYKIAFYVLLWIIAGFWVAFKRDWYKDRKGETDDYGDRGDDFQAVSLVFGVVFAPVSLLIAFVYEFIYKKWD